MTCTKYPRVSVIYFIVLFFYCMSKVAQYFGSFLYAQKLSDSDLMAHQKYIFCWQIVLTIATIVSIAIGQQREQRTKLKFRPPAQWFANMQPANMEQSPSYFEQSDQPANDNESPFQDLYIEDYEPEADTQFSGGSKYARHPSMDPPVFQSLCPTSRTDVFLNNDSDYEYRPSSYVEVKCEFYNCTKFMKVWNVHDTNIILICRQKIGSHPFGRNALMHQRNKVCGHHGFSCIQLNRTIFLTKRSVGSDCWEVEARIIPSGCECMWPKHHKGKNNIIIFKLLFLLSPLCRKKWLFKKKKLHSLYSALFLSPGDILKHH